MSDWTEAEYKQILNA